MQRVVVFCGATVKKKKACVLPYSLRIRKVKVIKVDCTNKNSLCPRLRFLGVLLVMV